MALSSCRLNPAYTARLDGNNNRHRNPQGVTWSAVGQWGCLYRAYGDIACSLPSLLRGGLPSPPGAPVLWHQALVSDAFAEQNCHSLEVSTHSCPEAIGVCYWRKMWGEGGRIGQRWSSYPLLLCIGVTDSAESGQSNHSRVFPIYFLKE